jgi:hypothetical protein
MVAVLIAGPEVPFVNGATVGLKDHMWLSSARASTGPGVAGSPKT